jgi:hypothetical protein
VSAEKEGKKEGGSVKASRQEVARVSQWTVRDEVFLDEVKDSCNLL